MPALAEQTHFEFLVPVTKELMRVDEVTDILRREKDSVYALVDEGRLEAHQPDGRHAHYRITRRSVIAHLAETSLYEPDDFVATLLSLAQRLTTAQRATLLKKLQNLN
jgi:excisionase family DNA binding protein